MALLEAHEQSWPEGFSGDTTALDFELVDVVCIGSGSAGLAAAVAAADAGQSVFVAEPHRHTSTSGSVGESESWAAVIQRHWGAGAFDESTSDYLHELTCDVGAPRRSQIGEMTVGSVESFEEARFDPRRPVPPFYGHQMAGWAHECLTSPYGLVFSRLTPLPMSELRMQDGSTVRGGVIAATPPARRAELSLHQWLRELAVERGVTIHGSSGVQRLIFVDGEPVGAVLETPAGARQVWARRGVVMGTSNPEADEPLDRYPATLLRDGRLSLVSRNASRFARLELLTSAQGSDSFAPLPHPRSHHDVSGTLVG
jgi:glycine/D-amino acid oxidase-like deaminating enzyme